MRHEWISSVNDIYFCTLCGMATIRPEVEDQRLSCTFKPYEEGTGRDWEIGAGVIGG